ncbi:RICIN domain-containing protein [Myceligenerans pegani]|uniref:RICIN domain-containing protein n=1 Tax=Myceligenerans pegani TaxID=2776917 RepID=A0ABR9N5M1_9MICO|nr:RICIN domain-containing protein [Myceligenerans sp. TRM 65318]MBE1878561.1 RICIN domain-containing protein [Myceligenerans sp. TRM 65318]MBE3020832.1 RICIN domain-containing protein [Myceligenerans sp. TRM 65318]
MSRVRGLIAAAVAVIIAGALAVVVPTMAAAASSGAVVSQAGGKCLDLTDGSTANGTQPQMWTCYAGSANQTVTFADDGSVRLKGKCLDLAENNTSDGAVVHVWDCYSSVATQRWALTGAGDLVNLAADKCLDIKDGNMADGAKLQVWTCTGASHQKWRFTGTTTPPAQDPDPILPHPANPDLGPNVEVFDTSMSDSAIQARLDAVFDAQEEAQFGDARKAFLFYPGGYDVDANIGFFTQIAGLGLTPDATNVNGHVHVEADWWHDGSQNATHNFWRSAEGLSVTPPDGADRWSVSQAAPYRRMHLRGNLALSDGGWSSGGFMADTVVDGQIDSGTQQQWLTRSSTIGSWTGSNWNQVFVGVDGAPSNSFPSPPYTTVAQAPKIAEKPYLYVDTDGMYRVFVPAVRSNTSGTTWAGGDPAGTSLPISDFAVIRPGDTAATMNAALAAGKNLLVTPGVYYLDQTLRVDRAGTVVLGLGLATLVPDGGIDAMHVADVDGVRLAGILFDAGTTNTDTILRVGPEGASADHASDPTVLSDVFVRVGGAIAGKATKSIVVNSDDVIGDHAWIWRADHGNGGTVGWNINTARNGLVVNGDDVTFYGLFVEHYQQYQTIWNGERGRTYFYQNEMPYDPPNQAAYMNGATRGWAAYKVGDHVTTHEAWGLGSYAFFNVDPSIVNDRAFEVPNRSGVRFHDMVTVSLGGNGTIAHVINNTGDAANSSHPVTYLTAGP